LKLEAALPTIAHKDDHVNAVSKSILVVDDDEEICELLQAYLSRSGFQVRTVGDGAEFRQAFNEEASDLLILDVMLPDEDGFSLCRWVRQHPRQPHIPIIMLTASSDEADRVIGLELGADDYMAKPFSPRELQARNAAAVKCWCSMSGGWTWSVIGCFTTTAKR
jgi:two-component system OmpR family response regulator